MSEYKFYIDTEGNDDKAYIEALKKASELVQSDNDIKKVVLLLSTKNNTGWVERLLGFDGVKKLFNGSKIDGLTGHYKIETKRTYKDGYSPSDVVITCGWESENVSEIDDYHSAKYIIAVPWLKGGLAQWVDTWNATELRGKTALPQTELPCVIRLAFEDLTSSVNMSTALSHPSDVELAKTYVLALMKYQKTIDSGAVGGYLRSKLGWETRQAKQVTDMIDTLNNGRFFKGGDRSQLRYHFNRWKERCAE